MLATGVFNYAGIHTRVRARYSQLLTPQEWSDLINALDYSALIGSLRRTVYGPYLLRLDEEALTPSRAVYQIESQMADTFSTLIRLAPERTCPTLTRLYSNFEVSNLKAVLRGILIGASWDQIQYILFPLGENTDLPAQAMLQAGNIPSAVELLKGTPYYTPLSLALERYHQEQKLFPLEVALDLAYWREMWEAVNHLPGADRAQALRMIGALVDVNNLMWAIRYRVYYQLSEEEIINYTLPFGVRVRDRDIRAIASGSDIAQVVARIYPRMPSIASSLLDPRLGLPEVEVQLERHVMEQCRKAFIGYPFHIGIPLGYLVLKKMEIQVLTVLIEAKATKMAVEDFRPYLSVGPAQK